MSAANRRYSTPLAGFLLGLCKPAYFLISLLAFRKRLAAVLIIGATLAGSAIAIANAARGHTPRSDVAIDTAAQRRCVVERPLHRLRTHPGSRPRRQASTSRPGKRWGRSWRACRTTWPR